MEVLDKMEYSLKKEKERLARLKISINQASLNISQLELKKLEQEAEINAKKEIKILEKPKVLNLIEDSEKPYLNLKDIFNSSQLKKINSYKKRSFFK